MAKVTKKRTTVESITLKHISQKIDHLHKDVETNHKDIIALKEQVAMGKVGLKVIFLICAVVGAVLTTLKIKKDLSIIHI